MHYLTDTLTGEVIYVGTLEACEQRVSTARAMGYDPIVVEASPEWRKF